MLRRIIEIDETKCSGCGACAEACHEGAIAMVGGKAKLTRDDYCDGLGDCLPTCPTGAEANMAAKKSSADKLPCGCPGTQARGITRSAEAQESAACSAQTVSRLSQWPVQIRLVPVNAPYFDGAKLLVAADCTAFARADFHERFIKNHVTLVGCPKLDAVDYAEKLTEILKSNDIKSLTVVRMEVPCCGGLEAAVKSALQASGKFIPWQVVTITVDGRILD